ncbi:asparagine synthase (glutamine-hydrolyzing) [Candidatus Woesearchaeota archaeon]|nr:asparagine synthase (glutamine-hydrolyzing) [Candidatus Woesearchaeota archaeon]
MCGILGFNWNDRRLCENLAKCLDHLGPDQDGIYTDKSISLGHRRLSIVDLSPSGRQPMSNKEKDICIVYNGEIFNYKEIKAELKKKGYTFSSQTDTEVLIHSYAEYGEGMLNRLNGQFAFCIYDKKKQQLFLARDRLGINPLYYYFDGKKFVFGSELKVILNAGVERKINENALHYYLMYGCTPPKDSIIKNAWKIEPGHYLIFDLKRKKIKKYAKYWKIELTDEIKDAKTAEKLILEKLENAVQARLMGDVPVGAFLSGGIDSSAVVAMISKYKKNLKTFSVKFEDEKFDESKYAMEVSKKFNTEHYTIGCSDEEVKKLIPELRYHYDEPFADPSMIPTFLVSRVASKHVKVSLSGDGGDELFGGYTIYKDYRTIQFQKYYPLWINKVLYNVCNSLKTPKLRKIKAFFEIGTLPPPLKYARMMSFLSAEEFTGLTKGDAYASYKIYEMYYTKNFLQTAIKSDLHIYLPEDILTKVDRASLANSLESRPPLLDHELVELACKIHPKLKLKGNEGKWIFKKTLAGILPKNILYRKKMGFGVPLEHYLDTCLKEIVEKYVLNFDQHSYFDREYIKRSMDQGNKNSRMIWAILMFNLWWERWMK